MLTAVRAGAIGWLTGMPSGVLLSGRRVRAAGIAAGRRRGCAESLQRRNCNRQQDPHGNKIFQQSAHKRFQFMLVSPLAQVFEAVATCGERSRRRTAYAGRPACPARRHSRFAAQPPARSAGAGTATRGYRSDRKRRRAPRGRRHKRTTCTAVRHVRRKRRAARPCRSSAQRPRADWPPGARGQIAPASNIALEQRPARLHNISDHQGEPVFIVCHNEMCSAPAAVPRVGNDAAAVHVIRDGASGGIRNHGPLQRG